MDDKDTKLRLTSPDYRLIPEINNPPVLPWAIVREIDLMAIPPSDGNTKWQMYYSFKSPDRRRSIANMNGLETLVRQIVANTNYPRNGSSPPYPKPLDLKMRQPSYVIFVLSSTWNWSFSKEYPGITLGVDPSRPLKGVYGNLRHATSSNWRSPTPQRRCQVVFFEAHQPVQNYRDPINLNIDLWFEDRDPDGGLNDRVRLPIIIDPEIRHPGGSEP